MKIKIIYTTDKFIEKVIECDYFTETPSGYDFYGENRKFLFFVKNVISLERLEP